MKRSILFIALASCMLIGTSGVSAGEAVTDASVVKEDVRIEAVAPNIVTTFTAVDHGHVVYAVEAASVRCNSFCGSIDDLDENGQFTYIEKHDCILDETIEHRYKPPLLDERPWRFTSDNYGHYLKPKDAEAYRHARDGLSCA